MKSESTKSITVHCDCSEISHQIRFLYYIDEEDGNLYVETAMGIEVGLFTRIKNALKYIFRMGEFNWVFNSTILIPSDSRDLLHFLQQHQDFISKNPELFR